MSQGKSAFTLIELLITVAILSIILVMAFPIFSRAITDARNTRAIGDIKALEKEILLFELRTRALPASLTEIGKAELVDPWDHPYQYVNFSTLVTNAHGNITSGARMDKNLHPINTTYDLYSMGEDGDTNLPLTAQASQDDIVRACDGSFVGLAENF